jgi:hypothetical protein
MWRDETVCSSFAHIVLANLVACYIYTRPCHQHPRALSPLASSELSLANSYGS